MHGYSLTNTDHMIQSVQLSELAKISSYSPITLMPYMAEIPIALKLHCQNIDW